MNVTEKMPEILRDYSQIQINSFSKEELDNIELKFIKSCILDYNFPSLNKYIKLKKCHNLTDEIICSVINDCNIKYSKSFLISLKNKDFFYSASILAVEKPLVLFFKNVNPTITDNFVKRAYISNLYYTKFDTLKIIEENFNLDLEKGFLEEALSYHENHLAYILIPLYYKSNWKPFVIEFLYNNKHLIDNFNDKIKVPKF